MSKDDIDTARRVASAGLSPNPGIVLAVLEDFDNLRHESKRRGEIIKEAANWISRTQFRVSDEEQKKFAQELLCKLHGNAPHNDECGGEP